MNLTSLDFDIRYVVYIYCKKKSYISLFLSKIYNAKYFAKTDLFYPSICPMCPYTNLVKPYCLSINCYVVKLFFVQTIVSFFNCVRVLHFLKSSFPLCHIFCCGQNKDLSMVSNFLIPHPAKFLSKEYKTQYYYQYKQF